MNKLLRILMLIVFVTAPTACGVAPEIASEAPAIVEFAIVGKSIGAAEVANGLQSVYAGAPQTFALTDGTVTMFAWPSNFGRTWAAAYWSNATSGWVGFKTSAVNMSQLYNQLMEQGYSLVKDVSQLPAELQTMLSTASPAIISTITFLAQMPILVVPMTVDQEGNSIFTPPSSVEVIDT